MTATRKLTTALFGTIAGAVAFVAIAMQGIGADDTHWNVQADTHWSVSQGGGDNGPDDTHWSIAGDDDPATGEDTEDTHW